MNTRVFAALFTVIFLVGAIPMLLVHPSGAASAGLAAGFVLPLGNLLHVCILISIGLLSAA
jgi:hydrogenase/urease accessory protein HupE